ncbi:LysR substrate-binding domain-containing protein [Robbsia andropogonis]|uniref:LysR substrate-binding domain-containing protein n=1 Tax=Robbsia andropogonis TaxID=28092 RepID=UPI00209FCE68|nr:LysR substrate-binding domain-containing protein [Robbsia andropogonis]MCP1120803.1 LysR substrate-binding domain-containing protein [Robbsia andropogonis]MCP1130596.1 LysR substrate-binding domain-containing protein [Robbsia andropogonis]
MARRLPNLNSLRAFEAAARHLSFSRAADELFVTQGAISRQIKSLEDALGVSLFRRLTRTVDLTEHGREYLPVVREAFDRVEQATLRLVNRERHRILNVNVLPTFAMRWLIPRLPSFALAHPDIEIRMITSIRPINFWREDIDVAIRVGQIPDSPQTSNGPRPRIDIQMTEDWSNVRCYPLMPDVLIPVCSKSLLERLPPLQRAEQLLEIPQLPLLHMSTRIHAWPDWFRASGIEYAIPEQTPAHGHFFMVLEAALAGAGIALVPKALAAADIDAGRLAVPLDLAQESAGSYCFLCREHQADTDAVQAFRDWIFSQRDATDVPPAEATTGEGDAPRIYATL